MRYRKGGEIIAVDHYLSYRGQVLECWESEIPEERGNYSSGPLSILEGSSAGMLGERDTGGEKKL